MTTETSARFGLLLKRYRPAAGLTQEMLAERARISKRGLQDLERDPRRRPRLNTAELLADALELAASDRAAFLVAAQQRITSSGSGSVTVSPLAFPSNAPVSLVGREREMAVVGRFLAGQDALSASPLVLLVAGEPGIGKTHLLRALARQAAAAGWCVLTGGSRRRGGEEPYVPLVEALADHIRALVPARRHEALAGCEWLGRLLPELGVPGGMVLSPDHERRLIYEAVGRFLINVAGPSGALLLFDDLQWAGADALDLVHSLARTAGSRLRIVGAYRDTETRLIPLLDRPGLEECDVTLLLPVLAWAQLDLGQLEPAVQTVEQVFTRARPEHMQLVLVEALRIRAMIALRREYWDEAAGSLEEGLALAQNMPYPHAEARLLDLEGQLRAHNGDPAAAHLW